MRWPTRKSYAVERREKRIPMEVAVQLAGHDRLPGVETTFTEDISTRGARVITARPWKVEDHLVLALLPGNFHSLARVAYCEPRRGEGFAIGLELLEPTGRWVIQPRVSAENAPGDSKRAAR